MFRVGIFIPVYHREEMVKKCLDSLTTTLFHKIDPFLCIGLNGAKSDFRESYLATYVKEHYGKTFDYIKVFDVGKNIGKPSMVNFMSSRYNDFNFLVSIDSDMVTINPRWLVDMLKIFHMYRGNKPIGSLCVNQAGNNVHTVKGFTDHLSMKVEEFTLWMTPKNYGVGGGVLMTPRDVWNHIGGYRAHNIYGSDDGHYNLDCASRGKISAYVDEIKFYHPSEESDDYSKWKLRAAKNQLAEDEERGYIFNADIQT